MSNPRTPHRYTTALRDPEENEGFIHDSPDRPQSAVTRHPTGQSYFVRGRWSSVPPGDEDLEEEEEEEEVESHVGGAPRTPRLPEVDVGRPLLWEGTDLTQHDPFLPANRTPSRAPSTNTHLSPAATGTPYLRSPSRAPSTAASYASGISPRAVSRFQPPPSQQGRSRSPSPTLDGDDDDDDWDESHPANKTMEVHAQWTGYETAPSTPAPPPAIFETDYQRAARALHTRFASNAAPQNQPLYSKPGQPAILQASHFPEQSDSDSVTVADSDASSQHTKASKTSKPSITSSSSSQTVPTRASWRSSFATTEPGTPSKMHFGPAPEGRQQRRFNKLKKKVALTRGNLIVDSDVPPRLLLPIGRNDEEMRRTRYTAVTCDPDEFEQRGFFLRQNSIGRQTELMIVITMYNEDEILFCRTLYGVMQNISHLCSRKNSRVWGPESWKKVVVCIIADGRKKVHPRVLDCLTLLGVYQPEGPMIKRLNYRDVQAHLFEYTTTFGLDPNLHFKYPDKGIVPTQVLFCMKENNQRKINSHRWAFNAFGRMLQPNVVVLLDVGTRPSPKSIYHLWKAFDVNSNVAGACGEIAAYKGKRWSGLLNPLVAAQDFEYKIANILDKPTESIFGYISVLPGAFSAYRYIALLNDKDGVGPLASYFKGESMHGRDTDIFTSNMYLAEDRILCFELVAKANSRWVLKYVKSAVAHTDVPDSLPEFIGQRRRWLNGSFFAATYAVAHTGQILRSGHSVRRKFALMIETCYNTMNLFFSWFTIGNFYLFFVILTSSLESPAFGLKGIAGWNWIVQYVMASLIIGSFLFSVGTKPRVSHWKYKLSAIMMALLMIYVFAGAIRCAIQAAQEGGLANHLMIFSVIMTYGVYTISSFLAFDPWHMGPSFISYMLLLPTYVNILNVYAFSNLDDISWGTKEDTVVENDLGAVVQDFRAHVDVEVLVNAADIDGVYAEAVENLKTRKPVVKPRVAPDTEQIAKDYYANVRTNVLLAWVVSNGLLLVGVLGGSGNSSAFSSDGQMTRTRAYMTFTLAFVAISNIIRFGCSTLYLIIYLFTG